MFFLTFISFCFLFLIGIHSMQDGKAATKFVVSRKEAQKRLYHTGHLFRKNLLLKDVC